MNDLVSFQPYVRKEACMGLYKLRLGKTADNKRCYSFLFPILSSLLSLLPEALLFKPQKNVEVLFDIVVIQL